MRVSSPGNKLQRIHCGFWKDNNMALLTVIIVTYNPPEHFRDYVGKLEGIKVSTGAWRKKVIIVDNGSRDSSFITSSALTEVIHNRANLGFAKGVNIGIRKALSYGSDKILLLNQDVILSGEVLSKLVSAPPGIVSPVLKFKREGRWLYDFGGYITRLFQRAKHRENTSVKDYPREKRVFYPDYVSGACMLISRIVFEKIGLFDERFFMYFEDVDFCMRAKNAHLPVSVIQNAVTEHRFTPGLRKPFHLQLTTLKSNLRYLLKYPRITTPLAVWYLLLVLIKITYRQLFLK